MLTNPEILEIGNIISDFFKQMIILDTAMVTAVVTIVEKVFTTERVFKSLLNRSLLIASLSSFIFSLLFSLGALVEVPNKLVEMLSGGILLEWVGKGSYTGCVSLFVSGVIFFIALAVISAFTGPSSDKQPVPGDKELPQSQTTN